MSIKFVQWVAGLTNKSTPDDTNRVYVEDAGVSKYTTWAQIKTALNALYAKVGLATGSGLTSTTAKLLGRASSGTGAVEEITLGTGLSFTGTTLNASGGGSGSPGGLTTQVQYNNAGAFGGASGITTTGTELTIASGTKTANAPVLNLTQTWNNSGVTFNGVTVNVTDTASNVQSLLLHLLVGGNSKFYIRKDGFFGGGEYIGSFTASQGVTSNSLMVCTTNLYFGSGTDAVLRRDAANVISILKSTTTTDYGDLKLRNLIGTGNLSTGIVAKTADYTATANDGTIQIDSTSAPVTITLFPCATNAGKMLSFKRINGGANAVTIDANASETIDGAATVALASQWSELNIQVNAAGTGWLKLSGV